MRVVTQDVTSPTQLEILKNQIDNPVDQDEILQFCLDSASEIICDIRNSNKVEQKYLSAQISIAIEIYNRRGAEGQIAHDENGVKRMYDRGHISNSVLSRITPMIKPMSGRVRVII